jgi:capsular polysaccharide transport system permease protein
MVVVALPTLLTTIFFLIFAAPRYVSETKFIVRSPEHNASATTLTLQGVGIPSGQNDSFAVHDYITSRDALKDLEREFQVGAMLGRQEADFLFRYPRIGESRSAEGLYAALQRFVHVGYDASTGISTLRVEAFRPEDAYRLNRALLAGGEQLLNRLNERAASDTIRASQAAYDAAALSLANVQRRLTNLRNQAGFVDPSIAASESSGLIAGLRSSIAQLAAERAQLIQQAPESPALPSLTGRIAALQAQVDAERLKVAGSDNSLAPKVGSYQDLLVEREIADKQLALASNGLISARQESARQQLYLERVVSPNQPDVATLPNRWRAILTVLISTLLLYSVGWLVWAGVREHRQD